MNVTKNRRDTLQALRTRGLAVPHTVNSQLEREIPDRETRNWSWWAAIWPRPTAATWQYSESELEQVQRSWDASRKHVDAQNVASAELEARKTQEAERQRVEAEKQATATREKLLIEPRRAFLASGGDPAKWDEIKDSIAATIAERAAIDAAKPQPSTPILPNSLYR